MLSASVGLFEGVFRGQLISGVLWPTKSLDLRSPDLIGFVENAARSDHPHTLEELQVSI